MVQFSLQEKQNLLYRIKTTESKVEGKTRQKKNTMAKYK